MLGIKTTYLFDVPRVGESLAVGGLELICAGSEHLCYDVGTLSWWGELVAILLALHSPQHQVTDIERTPSNVVMMVPTQGLLVFGRS